MKEAKSTEELYVEEIDFAPLFSVLWKKRKLIIFGTLGATLMALGISFLVPRVYKSEGFYQLGNPTKKMIENEKTIKKNTAISTKKIAPIGIPVPLYKRGSSQFLDPNRFQLIANRDQSLGREEIKKIKDNFKTAEEINKWFKPVYAFAKEDTREFAQLPQDESNSVIGLSLSYEAESPESASSYVGFFGKYIRDCLLYLTLYNYLADEYSSIVSKINKNENDIIGIQFEILQNTNKMKDIRAILSNYPESAKIENRQLVSIQEGGDRFLGPTTQLVGIESTLADLRRDLAELKRAKEQLAIRSEYFSRCYSELEKTNEHGESLFLLLKATKDEVFKNKDLGKDEVKEVFNNLSIDLQGFDFTFYQNSRFISGPTIPIEPIKPRKVIIVIVTFAASFFFFLAWAFFFHWWQINKKAIMSISFV